MLKRLAIEWPPNRCLALNGISRCGEGRLWARYTLRRLLKLVTICAEAGST